MTQTALLGRSEGPAAASRSGWEERGSEPRGQPGRGSGKGRGARRARKRAGQRGSENPVAEGKTHVFSCGEEGENGWKNRFKDKDEVRQEIQQASKDQTRQA